MKHSKYMVLVTLLFCTTVSLHALEVCLESPEDPTAVLALLGSAAVSAVYVRDRLKARMKPGKD